ncbi:unnamed protein product [Didymodactylos carnosus]|uniref:Uncharacterized protein n=1 Tax=Didymodactylos carnosus TaxID=1234261 RepID=A0A814LEQ3_9BILA|nr:unnamed protein product [Didymodactylos carnosus]CAF1163497.1 unnamed protein product [Didymodactylos carnosus]CAF3832938.1 unnamed protein product [Didymodactylos carnosus]CAF3975163.1 unnamed protein product [Didymodactylos carnosus]
MTSRFIGKTAFITGGSSGIGQAIARLLSSEGARVIIADLQEPIKPWASDQRLFIKTDVTNPESVRKAVTSQKSQLDIIINNAGIFHPSIPIHKCPLDSWHQQMDVNLNGAFYVMKYGLEQMIKQNLDGGVIINTSSIAGIFPESNNAGYNCSKAALIHLTKEAARHYGKYKIRVNAIAPTAVRTPLLSKYISESKDSTLVKERLENLSVIPGYLPEPEDIAAVVAFLASDEAKFITGTVLPVDAGYLVM